MIDSVECSSTNPSVSDAHGDFLAMLPELQSRCRQMVRKLPRRLREDAAADAVRSMFVNHLQAAKKGKQLRPAALAWAAMQNLRHRSLVMHLNPSKLGRRSVSLQSAIEDGGDLARQVAAAVATNKWDDPAEHCRLKIDWRDLASRLPERQQKIVYWLATGGTKSEIADRLGVSRCRITQLLEEIGRVILPYVVSE